MFPISQLCSFFLRPFYAFHTCMRRPGCFPGAWSSWSLQVVSLHLKAWTSLSASVVRILFILRCERAQRAAEAARGAKRVVYQYACTRYRRVICICMKLTFLRNTKLFSSDRGSFLTLSAEARRGPGSTPRYKCGSRPGSVESALGVQSSDIWQVTTGSLSHELRRANQTRANPP